MSFTHPLFLYGRNNVIMYVWYHFLENSSHVKQYKSLMITVMKYGFADSHQMA
jgi:hypothetical protein